MPSAPRQPMTDPADDPSVRAAVADLVAAVGLELDAAPLEPLGEVGLMGTVVRARTAEGGSVVAKLPSTDPQNDGVAKGFGYYEREAVFYRELADLVRGLVPNCLGVFDNGDSSVSLVLEDHSDLSRADQLKGATAPQARLAIDGLALVHARTWDHDRLAEVDLPDPTDQRVAGFGPLFDLTWPGFAASFGDLVDDEVDAKAHRIMEGYDAACVHLTQAPSCLVHGDFRLDNLLFGPDAVLVLDWQLASTGRGAYDLCRFLCGSLTPTAHAELKTELTDRYWQRLCDASVANYSRSQLDADLAAAFVTFLPIPVTVAVGVASLDERGARLKRVLAERLCAAIRSHDLP